MGSETIREAEAADAPAIGDNEERERDVLYRWELP